MAASKPKREVNKREPRQTTLRSEENYADVLARFGLDARARVTVDGQTAVPVLVGDILRSEESSEADIRKVHKLFKRAWQDIRQAIELSKRIPLLNLEHLDHFNHLYAIPSVIARAGEAVAFHETKRRGRNGASRKGGPSLQLNKRAALEAAIRALIAKPMQFGTLCMKSPTPAPKSKDEAVNMAADYVAAVWCACAFEKSSDWPSVKDKFRKMGHEVYAALTPR